MYMHTKFQDHSIYIVHPVCKNIKCQKMATLSWKHCKSWNMGRQLLVGYGSSIWGMCLVVCGSTAGCLASCAIGIQSMDILSLTHSHPPTPSPLTHTFIHSLTHSLTHTFIDHSLRLAWASWNMGIMLPRQLLVAVWVMYVACVVVCSSTAGCLASSAIWLEFYPWSLTHSPTHSLHSHTHIHSHTLTHTHSSHSHTLRLGMSKICCIFFWHNRLLSGNG